MKKEAEDREEREKELMTVGEQHKLPRLFRAQSPPRNPRFHVPANTTEQFSSVSTVNASMSNLSHLIIQQIKKDQVCKLT